MNYCTIKEISCNFHNFSAVSSAKPSSRFASSCPEKMAQTKSTNTSERLVRVRELGIRNVHPHLLHKSCRC